MKSGVYIFSLYLQNEKEEEKVNFFVEKRFLGSSTKSTKVEVNES